MPKIVFDKNDGRTQQKFKKETNINTIIERYGRTGVAPLMAMSPKYGDFTNVEDYHTSLNRVVRARDEFDALPARLRKRFGNDPAQLIDFVQDEGNRDEAIELGLIIDESKPEPKKIGETIDDVEPKKTKKQDKKTASDDA